MLEELLPAQNQSYELGLKLNLKPHEVKSIHTTYSEPQSRLLHVVIEFLNEVDPNPPTWRVIVDALKSHVVNLPHLAKVVEAAHCPDITSTPVVPKASGRCAKVRRYSRLSMTLNIIFNMIITLSVSLQSLYHLRVQSYPHNNQVPHPHLSLVMTDLGIYTLLSFTCSCFCE